MGDRANSFDRLEEINRELGALEARRQGLESERAALRAALEGVTVTLTPVKIIPRENIPTAEGVVVPPAVQAAADTVRSFGRSANADEVAAKLGKPRQGVYVALIRAKNIGLLKMAGKGMFEAVKE